MSGLILWGVTKKVLKYEKIYVLLETLEIADIVIS